MLLGEDAAKALKEEFHTIFDGLLIGKQLKGLSLSKHGGVSVIIEEKQSGKTYDLDRMSSGEKGLILQFLLMRHSLAEDGIVLIDEPELHLNPAVCKRLIPFFIDHVIKPRRIQAIVCSHSAEILAAAFERDDCQLFHLRSGKDLSPVLREDKAEVFEALKRLGAGTSDVLFSKGTLFVEGVHDADLLESGFANRVSSLKITQLRGRGEIEKEIRNLQSEESDGHHTETSYFLFDRDRAPTELSSSTLVRIQQWQRYCFENYLLDSDVIYDVCRDGGATKHPESRSSLKTSIKGIAVSQLKGMVAREVYKKLEPENCGLRGSEVDHLATYFEIADVLFDRVEKLKVQLSSHSKVAWSAEFNRRCDELEAELKTKWNEDWHIECDGKKVLQAVHREFGVKGSLLEFKKRVIRRMAAVPTESWRAVDSVLNDLLK